VLPYYDQNVIRPSASEMAYAGFNIICRGGCKKRLRPLAKKYLTLYAQFQYLLTLNEVLLTALSVDFHDKGLHA